METTWYCHACSTTNKDSIYCISCGALGNQSVFVDSPTSIETCTCGNYPMCLESQNSAKWNAFAVTQMWTCCICAFENSDLEESQACLHCGFKKFDVGIVAADEVKTSREAYTLKRDPPSDKIPSQEAMCHRTNLHQLQAEKLLFGIERDAGTTTIRVDKKIDALSKSTVARRYINSSIANNIQYNKLEAAITTKSDELGIPLAQATECLDVDKAASVALDHISVFEAHALHRNELDKTLCLQTNGAIDGRCEIVQSCCVEFKENENKQCSAHWTNCENQEAASVASFPTPPQQSTK
ncbi:Aste57867_7544 [Aphanomyces stellatus]|uniref:Aste57867_4631 protein n=1 Tax=Aphanomyces stellatus TaxID=120398 RepID=A0A485KIG6_9STRA|nr:hypothetical protein As57867_007518 [Aphanomyces stellatus]KAF0712851.1 hypothetical protein As57867_004618 [Aphanomyces stellatus]VFT81735.1 Aste57867_4631 [Aphanomyces stellatus]VFT84453.1 Aste57867_7544 [Aphanomyces stellatus]